VVRAALSWTDQYQILALLYPVDYQAFWRVLDYLGLTQERLMSLTGAGP
jgi:hypothetical protein